MVRVLLTYGLSLFLIFKANGSVTKVGNGDDGTDLESLVPIKSGPIFKSRHKAVQLLNSLNVAGVPGLGLLIPELERSDLLLASRDVSATTEIEGSIEISEVQKLVYARTFPEPYAATRFFPVAQKLSSEQLVALHVHEALHRALPVDIRTNENIVMHLTMAITSPGANFDRIRTVSSLYLNPPSPQQAIASESPALKSTTIALEKNVLPPKSKTTFGYEFNNYSDLKWAGANNSKSVLHGFEMLTSLLGYQEIKGYAVEPVFRARMKFSDESDGAGLKLRASSFDIEARVQTDATKLIGPFFRFTAKSIDQKKDGSDFNYMSNGDRDIITFGGFYRSEKDQSYFESILSYSLPSSSDLAGTKTNYKSILSLTWREGWKWRALRAGGLAELHSFEGSETTYNVKHFSLSGSSWGESVPAIRLLTFGPEVSYSNERFQIKAFYKTVMNSTDYDLSHLGDIMDHGAGRSGMGIAMSYSL